MRNFWLTLARKLAYVLAACVIMVALIASTVRFLTPLLNQHRADFEKWAGQLLDLPISIGEVHVSWYQYQPEVYLSQVTVQSKDKTKTLLHIQKIHIFFSIPKSIWQRQLVPARILFAGSRIKLQQDEKGSISLQGFPSLSGLNGVQYLSETKLPDALVWLSSQVNITLKNIDVRYLSHEGHSFWVTLYGLSIKNDGDHHVMDGRAVLHQDVPTRVTFSTAWQGSPLDVAKMKAKLYLYVSGFSLSQWLTPHSWYGWQIKDGMVSAKIWAIWHFGQFTNIQTTLQTYGLGLYSEADQSIHKINRISGHFGWKREQMNQLVTGENILVDLPTRLWPLSRFYVLLAPDETAALRLKTMQLGYVNLQDIQTFLFATRSFPESLQKTLLLFKLKGDIDDSVITFKGDWKDYHQTSLNLNFHHVGVAALQNWPGIDNVSGALNWDGLKGKVAFNTQQAVIKLDHVFLKPLQWDQVTGGIEWQQQADNAWRLTASNLKVANNELLATVDGSMDMPQGDSPAVNLQAKFSMPMAKAVTHYLPMRIFDKHLNDWLQAAFLSGEVSNGEAVLRGKLSHYPFDHGDGEFKIAGTVQGVDFRFAPDWPILSNTSGKIVFAGRDMAVSVDQATLMGVSIGKARGVIPVLGDSSIPSILTIQSESVETDFTQGLAFVQASPLKKTLGKMFQGMTMNGPLNLTLGLRIPLAQIDNITVTGEINLKDTSLHLTPWNLSLNDLNGQLHFTEKSAEAKGLTGKLFNKPLQLDLGMVKRNGTSQLEARLATDLNVDDLENWLKLSLAKVATGGAKVTGRVDLSFDAPVRVHLESQLKGVALHLPDHYGKAANMSRQMTADITVQEKKPLKLKASYGDMLGAALILERKQGVFHIVAANLSLGAGEPGWPAETGLFITGSLDLLTLDDIKKYAGQTDAMSLPDGLILRGLNLFVKRIELMGQLLTQAQLTLTPYPAYWSVALLSPEVVGKWKMPLKLNANDTITAQFERLELQPVSPATQALPTWDLSALPAIQFNANHVNYNHMEVGNVSFKTSHAATGLSIDSLKIMSPFILLQASGSWLNVNKRYQTHLQGEATSQHVSHLLTSLGFDARNFVADKGKFNFKLNWRGAPFAPHIGSMNGHAALLLGKGRIVDIGKESNAKMDLGRMLNIFSLQTIPRRLSFDFSDVFQKGYSFDYLRGDLSVESGDIYTDNTKFDGPVARVEIVGRIGLVEQDYDLSLSVTPYVTSSIPVAATLFTLNPVVGLAALGVNTVISPAVSKATTHHYKVTGSWSEPVWASVNGKKKPTR